MGLPLRSTPSPVSKKFINKEDRVVDDSIRGLVFAHRNLQIHQSCGRVVLRSEYGEKGDDSKVSLIAGGGSGHEPFAAGFVGKGFLSAAVCGNIFASPPTAHVVSAIEAVRSKKGCVVFVINYTGDRLNFGLALERHKTKYGEEFPAQMVVIADDVALEKVPHGKGIGRRGLAGSTLLLKIVGAMAESGCDVEKIVETAQLVNSNMGTLGVSLEACSLPGKGHMFALGADEMEVGLGIHGEPGCERQSLANCDKVVDTILSRLTQSDKLQLESGAETVVLLNNLGST
ncbi:hypothetical protein AB6A40_010070, partial [Gnathostoma spinigerum]